VVVPASNVFRLPDDVPDDLAAFLDPFGNAVHTALSFDLVGEDVLVTGAGPIGLMAAAVARHVGARHVVITDVNEHRLALARQLGVSRAVDPRHLTMKEVMGDLGMTEGFDIGLEMSGNGEAFRSLLSHMNYGGRVALLGVPTGELSVDMTSIIFKGLIIKGIYGREMYETWYKMTSLLQSGLDIRPVLTHVLPAKDYHAAFELVRGGSCGKVVLDWTA
jgi:threonine 3-dehydrogenase